MTNLIQQHQKEIKKICQEEGISYLAIFGSHARGEATDNSDIDMLVEFSKPIGLLKHASVQLKLESLFQRKVDLITKKSLRPNFKKYIQDDIIQIL